MKTIKESLSINSKMIVENKYTPEEQQEIVTTAIDYIVNMLDKSIPLLKTEANRENNWEIKIYSWNPRYKDFIDQNLVAIPKNIRSKALAATVKYFESLRDLIEKDGANNFNPQILKKDTGTKWSGTVFTPKFNKEIEKLGEELNEQFRNEFCKDLGVEASEKVYFEYWNKHSKSYPELSYIPWFVSNALHNATKQVACIKAFTVLNNESFMMLSHQIENHENYLELTNDYAYSDISSGQMGIISREERGHVIESFDIWHVPSQSHRAASIVKELPSGLKDAFGREISVGDTVIRKDMGWRVSRVKGAQGKYVVLTKYEWKEFARALPESLIVVRHNGQDMNFEEFVDQN